MPLLPSQYCTGLRLTREEDRVRCRGELGPACAPLPPPCTPAPAAAGLPSPSTLTPCASLGAGPVPPPPLPPPLPPPPRPPRRCRRERLRPRLCSLPASEAGEESGAVGLSAPAAVCAPPPAPLLLQGSPLGPSPASSLSPSGPSLARVCCSFLTQFEANSGR